MASNGISKIKDWLGLITTSASILAAGSVGYYRLQEVEARVKTIETRVESKAEAKDLDELRRSIEELRATLGEIQLDLGQMCAAQFGAEKCYTSRTRHR